MRLVGSAAFKAVGTSDPRPAGSIPVHLRQFVRRRTRALIACALGFLVVSPAGIASADPAQPGNTESVVESMTPVNPAVKVDIVGGDAFVRVRVERGHTLRMNGYYDEEFLRIDADGIVSVNESAETFRISQDRYGTDVSTNGKVAEQGEAEWVVSSRNGTYLWHDHRVHWMGSGAPQTINDDGLVQQWAIAMTIDGASTVVSGNLYLRDAPGSWWWLLAIPALVVGFVLSRNQVLRVAVVAASVCAINGIVLFWGLPSAARGAPVVFVLGTFAFLVSVGTMAIRNRREISDALVASTVVALVLAIVIERDLVTNRFVPGFGDSIFPRLTVPLIAGFAVGSGARAVKRLVGKPEPIASN